MRWIAVGLALLIGDSGMAQGAAFPTDGHWVVELSDHFDAGARGDGSATFVMPGMGLGESHDGVIGFACRSTFGILQAWSQPSSFDGKTVPVYVRADHFDGPRGYEYVQAEWFPGGIQLEEGATLILIRKMMAPGAHTMYIRPEAENLLRTVNLRVHELPEMLRAAGFETWCGFQLGEP